MYVVLCMQTDKIMIEFQNSIVKLSFGAIQWTTDWINTCKIYIKSSDVSKTRRFINQLFIYLKKARSSSRYLKYK